MALPAGFNPNNMTFGNIARQQPVINIPRNSTTNFVQSSPSFTGTWTYPKRSLWSRFNASVTGIGNWFASKASTVIGWGTIAIIISIGAYGIYQVIQTWINDGFWWALGTAILVGLVGVLAFYIAVFIISIIVNVVMYGCRFVFWNGWTLLITLIVLISVWANSAFSSNPSWEDGPIVECVEEVTTPYTCTANVLNIRSNANSSSRVLGTIKKGQVVNVISQINGFAEIEVDGVHGYVSMKYLKEIQ